VRESPIILKLRIFRTSKSTDYKAANSTCNSFWKEFLLNLLTVKDCAAKKNYLLRPCVRRFFPKFSFSQVSEIAVFQKLGSERVFRTFSELVPDSWKLVPTRNSTRKFGSKFGMQGLTIYKGWKLENNSSRKKCWINLL